MWSFTTDPFERELIFRSSCIKVAKCQQKYFDSSHVNPYENVIHKQCLAELVFSCTLCCNTGHKPDSTQGSNNSLWSSRQFPSACSFEVPETSSVGKLHKSSISLSNTLNICLNIYLIIVIITMITISLSIVLFSIVCVILFPGSSFELFLSVLSNLYFKFVMYDSVWIFTHYVLKKMVTESLGAETNNFKPLIQLPARKRKQKLFHMQFR